jgi:hypothetical protein
MHKLIYSTKSLHFDLKKDVFKSFQKFSKVCKSLFYELNKMLNSIPDLWKSYPTFFESFGLILS